MQLKIQSNIEFDVLLVYGLILDIFTIIGYRNLTGTKRSTTDNMVRRFRENEFDSLACQTQESFQIILI